MMKKLTTLILFSLYLSLIHAQDNQVPKEIYDGAVEMLGANVNKYIDRANVRVTWMPDNKLYYNVLVPEGSRHVLYDINSKNKTSDHDYKALMQNQRAYPDSPKTKYTEILSPDQKKVVFIKDWNLWVRHLDSGYQKQLTTDGVENFGYATDNAGWKHSDRPIVLWSPDSRKIATFQQDQRHVSDMHLVSTKVGAPDLKSWKYPLPEDEDIIRIHRVIVDVENAETVRLEMSADPRRGTLCDDISCSGSFDDNEWSPDSKQLAFVSSSRDHKEAILRVADVMTGQVRDIYKEVVETQYESGQGSINWNILWGEEEFVWYSEKDNWGHLYLHDLSDGSLKKQLTQGDYVVTQVLHWDKQDRKIYFMANGKEENRDPYFSHFYSVDIDNGKVKLLTPEDANHRISISPDHDYFIDNYSTLVQPNVSKIRKINGEDWDLLEKADISRLKARGWQAPIPFSVKSSDGAYDLYGLMYVPANLDKNKKYPVINYVYPGPQGGSVGSRSFSASRRDHQALAELGFVVVTLDGTCNPDRSKAFHDACYGDMSVNTLPDQIAGIKQLAKRHPYMDIEKVGIWGHSGGGFATAAAMFKYPEFYDVGISESGNHDNRNYEDDWGERYVGLINGENYEIMANQLYAENLEGKLLLAHGGMDDNVPPFNTYLVVDALVKANKDFDLLIFPNARHGFGADTYYMMRRRWDYFVKHLQGKNPPKEYKIEVSKDPRRGGA